MSAAFLLRGDESDIDLLEDSGVFELEEEPRLSDTNQLVERCIAEVRAKARLDDDPVFPPLPVAAPRRQVVVLAKEALAIPTPGTIVREAAAKSEESVAKPARRPSRWPTRLCAVIALAAATASFLTSPLGHRPEVMRLRGEARAQAMHVVHGAMMLVER